MRLCTASWLLLFSLNVAFGQQNQDKIDWQPWSYTAFAQAKKEGRFLLLNLGAVWCHLCHVMDEITYLDPEVTELIRSHYVAVRVDEDSLSRLVELLPGVHPSASNWMKGLADPDSFRWFVRWWPFARTQLRLERELVPGRWDCLWVVKAKPQCVVSLGFCRLTMFQLENGRARMAFGKPAEVVKTVGYPRRRCTSGRRSGEHISASSGSVGDPFRMTSSEISSAKISPKLRT